ncbi:hypothetical protein PG985_004883 [Apiospora marii]|uniref:uncharacterized protein n=1 Tax=Apiospora marii TaxID=335849 RepID=UPI003131904F
MLKYKTIAHPLFPAADVHAAPGRTQDAATHGPEDEAPTGSEKRGRAVSDGPQHWIGEPGSAMVQGGSVY